MKLHNNGTNVGNDPDAIDAGDYFSPDVVSFSDYYPFGMGMPGRKFAAESYRYGFNGMEKNLDVNGEGNDYTTQFRQYDARIGKWKSLDPLMATYPFQSPFAAFNNNPIYFSDVTGLEGDPPTRNQETIKDGDTYSQKAKDSGGKYTAEDLEKWNPGVDPKKLQIGQKINTEGIESFTARTESYTADIYAKIATKVSVLKSKSTI